MVQLHTSGRGTKTGRYMILAYDVMQSVRCSGAWTGGVFFKEVAEGKGKAYGQEGGRRKENEWRGQQGSTSEPITNSKHP